MLLIDIARFVLDTVGIFLGSMLLLRAYMVFHGVSRRNPLGQFAFGLTDWLVVPMQNILPTTGRISWTSLIAAYLVALVVLALSVALAGVDIPWAVVLVSALLHVLQWALYMVLWLTILYAIVSWVNPQAPIAPALAMLVQPMLAPIQRVLPAISGIDLSPVVLIIAVNIGLLVISRSGY